MREEDGVARVCLSIDEPDLLEETLTIQVIPGEKDPAFDAASGKPMGSCKVRIPSLPRYSILIYKEN